MKKILFLVLITALFLPNVNSKAADLSKTKDNGPEIFVNRTNLNFGAIKDGDSTSSLTGSQNLYVANSGSGHLDWSLDDDSDWLICTPTFGTGNGVVAVSVAPCGLPAGVHTGTISITAPGASNSPQTVSVDLTVKNPSQDHPPFGSFATPLDGANVSSSVPVTGWALDDVEVENVKIYNGNSYIGDASFVEGARPDVEQSYPTYPMNYKAGWGYMMLTNFLPNGGNGTYHIKAVAIDTEGNKTTLGTKTITCDNAHAVKPFGAIDTPVQGGTASGSSYLNWGWALTPQPKHIPTDGSTINVWVDGANKGHVHEYNMYRQDIAEYFPGYENSDGAIGYFAFDTTTYHDGVHTIYWTATDNEGSADGIGSRYFTIDNTGGDRNANAASRVHKPSPIGIGHLRNLPVDRFTPVRIKKGFGMNGHREIYPGNRGLIRTEVKELELIEFDLSNGSAGITDISGGLLVGDQIRSLPIGSTLNSKTGVFSWIPAPAFFGEYHLVFTFSEKGSLTKKQKHVLVSVVPKS